MDAEEEHIRQRIEEREKALKQKVTLLKERIEQIKRFVDVKAMVYKRPALSVAGSVLTGFLIKKLASRRHAANGIYRSSMGHVQHDNAHPGRPGDRSSAKLKDALIAIVAGVASRTVTTVLSELAKRIIPAKYDVRRAERNFRSTRYNP
jgi:hypothetical protein